MTDHIVSQSTEKYCQQFHYSVQTDYERKKGGGLGRSERSYWKHDCIESFVCRQIPVLKKRGKGCIIDMHAGDGLDTPHPQPDFFSGGSLKTTPTIAIAEARRCGADVILCESNKGRRERLNYQFGQEARVVGNHTALIELLETLKRYQWLIILNDPNGHGAQGVSVMQQIASEIPISDFVIVVNHHGIKRCLGLTNPNHERASVRASYRSGVENAWMLEPEKWKAQLGKRMVYPSPVTRISPEMEAQILLVSNFIPGVK